MTQPLTSLAKDKIAYNIATGHTIPEAAELSGVSQASVSRVKSDPEVKAKIERISAEYAGEILDKIVETDKTIINTANKFVKAASPQEYQDASVLMGLNHKLSKGIKVQLGIAPSPTPSIFVQSLYMDNRGTTLAPGVLPLVSRVLAIPEDTEDQPIIDGEYSIIE